MNKHFSFIFAVLSLVALLMSCDVMSLDEQKVSASDHSPSGSVSNGERTADHNVVSLLWNGDIPESAIQQAKDRLHISYGHTSHGSQLTTGMSGLVEFANNGRLGGTEYSQNLFAFGGDEAEGSLHLVEGALRDDVGYPGWDDLTRVYLNGHPECNVIIWSWCGQVNERDLTDHYLGPMSSLESEYPNVDFVYMTGHLEGHGESMEDGSVYRSNEQIREYCENHNKWFYDFADIESYGPDGTYYRDRLADDGCNYDSNGDGTRDANWARAWQDSHVEGADWYLCVSQHSEPLNANMKAYAAWWLWCRLAGWGE